MTKLQKAALYNLTSIVAIFPTTVLWTLMMIKFSGLTRPLEASVGYFTILTNIQLIVAAVQARRVFCMQSDPKKIWFDERDQFINYRAVLCAYYTICCFLILGLVLSLVPVVNPTVSIPFYFLPLFLSSIALIVIFVYSVAVLVQYYWGGKHGE